MATELVHIGYGDCIATSRILAVVSPDPAPIRRMIKKGQEEGRVIDMTHGRRTKAVIILDSGHIALAAIRPETIASRLEGQAEATP